MHSPLLHFGQLLLLLIGLLAPGAALLGAFRLPRSLAGCFAGSAVAIYTCVLALNACSLRLSAASLTASLTALTLTAWFVGTRRAAAVSPGVSGPALSPAALAWFAPWRRLGPWTVPYVALAAALVVRACREPLAGPDVGFRWSFLAEQMLHLGSLDFYPPRFAADFLSYFWVESIPPGVAGLHAWAFACGGSSAPGWTVPAVILQLAALHDLLWRLGEKIGGVRAARFACLTALACPLLNWSFLLGQESGLTALALLGVLSALLSYADTRAPHWCAALGLFAVLGASTREYGLVFPALALGALLCLRPDRRAQWIFFTVAAPLSLAWPLRCALLTGNPFYSLDVAGLLPVNPRFHDWLTVIAQSFGPTLRHLEGWTNVGRYLLLYAPVAFLGWIALTSAASRRRPGAIVAALATLLFFALWAASVPYTNGGLFYSMRVLSPALAVATLVFGCALAVTPRISPSIANGLIALLLIATLPANLALPENPWRQPWREWAAFRSALDLSPAATPAAEPVDFVARTLRHQPAGLVLADAPGAQRELARFDRPVAPLWSPQADWLLAPGLASAARVQGWRASGARYLVLTKYPMNADYFTRLSRAAQPLFVFHRIDENDLVIVLSISLATP